ncbi:MAG: response regulator transcription factor [Planctomycetes bacterium]|nr:response regulator transcription factor [Planctomycetota bacterium]
MDILLVESDRLVRDQIKVGLHQFPEFQVTTGEGYGGLNKLRQQRYDLVFVGVRADSAEARRTIEYLRSFDQSIDLVVVAPHRTARDLVGEKSRLDIWSFLSTPIQDLDFFRLVARIRDRLHAAADASARPAARVSPG